MLASWSDSVRLFLHILGATVWVGGQLTLAALVPVLRAIDPSAPKAAARAFNKVAWPAYGLLVVTGIWNVLTLDDDVTPGYRRVLALKVIVVIGSGVFAWLHTRATTARGLAMYGALTGLTALSALYLGVLLAG